MMPMIFTGFFLIIVKTPQKVAIYSIHHFTQLSQAEKAPLSPLLWGR